MWSDGDLNYHQLLFVYYVLFICFYAFVTMLSILGTMLFNNIRQKFYYGLIRGSLLLTFIIIQLLTTGFQLTLVIHDLYYLENQVSYVYEGL